MNSLVQSASAGSRPACPEEAAESALDRNSAAQLPDSARAATSGAGKRKRIVITHKKSVKIGLYGPYFNDLSAWSKAHSAGALRAFPNPLLLV